MKEKGFEKPACSTQSAPFPDEVTCPRCGADIEIWSDEEVTSCSACGYRVFNHERIVS